MCKGLEEVFNISVELKGVQVIKEGSLNRGRAKRVIYGDGGCTAVGCSLVHERVQLVEERGKAESSKDRPKWTALCNTLFLEEGAWLALVIEEVALVVILVEEVKEGQDGMELGVLLEHIPDCLSGDGIEHVLNVKKEHDSGGDGG